MGTHILKSKIPEGWIIQTISESTEISGGSTPKSTIPEYWNGGIFWLTPKELTKNNFTHICKSERTISQEGLERGPRKLYSPGHVLMTSRAPVGIPVINDVPMAVNQGFIAISCKKIDCHFMYYWIKNNLDYLERYSNGTTFLEMSKSNFKTLNILFPKNIDEGKKIGKILYNLDKKIENIRNQNNILEKIAQSIFDSWFIKFDDVSEFENSKLGEIPKGWKIEQLDHIATFLNGLALQKFRPINDSFLPIIKIREMKNGLTKITEKATTDLEEKYIINDGDILFSWSGSLELIVWSFGRGALNQHIFKVTSKNYPKWFYYFWIKFHLINFRKIAEGKATTMGHIQKHHLSEALVIVPPTEIMEKIKPAMHHIFEKLVQNKILIQNLIKTRDLLLPKLLSGEIRV
jgi:type I restriction enzyme, S subunit